VIAEVSSHHFELFFAWAPWVIGIAIYFAFYVAKRHEVSVTASPGQTFACAVCGRRGPREGMVPQNHGGAIGYQCATCAAAGAQPVTH
jgi:hypothetical protein